MFDYNHLLFYIFVLKICANVIVLSTQVDHLEVVNKQYVKVIPAHGVNTSEVVSYMTVLLCHLFFSIISDRLSCSRVF